MKVSYRNRRRIVVDLSILFYIHWQIRSFRSCVKLTLLRGANVYRICFRISVRSIGYAISCAIDTRENVSPDDQFLSFEIYYTHLSHSVLWNERKLIGLSGDLECIVMSVKLPLHSPRRRDTCCIEIDSQTAGM